MNLISVRFLLLFLPIVVLVHYVVKPLRMKNIILLMASIVFYACYDVKYVVFFTLSIALTYFGGLLGRKIKLKHCYMHIIALMLNFLMLLVFKYEGFVLGSIGSVLARWGYKREVPHLLLPVGLSFFIFQSSTYLLDLHKGKMQVEKDFLDYALFVSFFPTITSGPIQRARSFLPQVKARSMPSFRKIEEAVLIFLWGAFLKSVIADRIGVFTDTVYAGYAQYSGWTLFVCALLYSVQIYADFSGYSYMAIAVSKLFGFELTENFHQPYFATNIADFWRRWHISLTSWFTEYLYIPLGGNRKGTARRYINIFIVFLTSGLWHGAGWNFIVWGGIHALYQIAGHLTKPVREGICLRLNIDRKKPGYRAGQMAFIYAAAAFAWIFFRAPSLTDALGYIGRMFSAWNPWVLFDGTLFSLGLGAAEWNVLIAAVILMVIVSYIRERGGNAALLAEQNLLCKTIVFEVLIIALAIFGMYGEGYSASAFIYAGF